VLDAARGQRPEAVGSSADSAFTLPSSIVMQAITSSIETRAP
jgi:hypothetical protein